MLFMNSPEVDIYWFDTLKQIGCELELSFDAL